MTHSTTKQLELPLFEIRIELSKTGRKYKGMYEAVVDAVDSDLNEVNWKVHISRRTQYAGRNIYEDSKCRLELLHRVVMGKILGKPIPDGYEVDHIDGNGLNNRRENLRLATPGQNRQNSSKTDNNTSGYKGVHWDKRGKKWKAQIRVKGKQKYLGLFNSKEEAHAAYCDAADELHGKFANYG